MTTPVFPEGQYDHTHAWQSNYDRVQWERMFSSGTEGQQMMAVAAITADPSTPDAEIRAKMTMPPPPAPCAPVKTSPTIDDVLGTPGQPAYGHMYDRSPTDFSRTPAGMEGSSRLNMP